MASMDFLPFPYALSIGTDICHIPRIQRILANENPGHADRFSRRIFSPEELSGFQEQYDKLLQLKRTISARPDEENGDDVLCSKYQRELWRISNWVAGRFAAKEAAMKAISPYPLRWHHAEVLTFPGRKKPVLILHAPLPANADSTNQEDNGQQLLRRQAAQLSISHDGDYATATVLAVNYSAV